MNRSPGSISAVIVTGGGGLIGSHLRRRHGDAVEFFSAQRSEGFDLLDRTSVFQFVKAHAEETYCLVHLAAYTDVTAAHRQKGKKDELCHRINVDGTRHVVDACNAFGLHLIHLSTDFVFDGVSPELIDETSVPNPI